MKQINSKNIKQTDKSDMLGLLLDFPKQCEAAKAIAGNARVIFEKRDFNKVVFCGLGGSAIGADLIRSYLFSEIPIPVTVIREYTLPAYLDSATLCFLVSYSGNTEETLSAYAQARSSGATIVAVSSGGALRKNAEKDKVTFIEVPAGLPPRCALGYLSVIPLCTLAKTGLIKDVSPHINQTVRVLEELKNASLHPRIGEKDNIAKYVAHKLFNKFPVIYSASIAFDVCATRLRGQIAENSKTLSSSHLFPEMNHNEIVGWQNPAKLFKHLLVVMLRDKEMHPRVAKRMDISAEILKKEGVNLIEIWSRGEGLLSRIFSLIYIGDFISYYLALLYGIDPTPVEKVTYLKDRLAKED